MAFKVKTTAPKLYCVRPNSGVLKPGESSDVTIIFQGLKDEPSLGYKCKDKFLFVSLPCSEDVDSKNVSSNWSKLEELAGGRSTDVKLKVLFSYDNPMNTIHEEDKSNISSHSIQNVPIVTPISNIEKQSEPIHAIETPIKNISTTSATTNITDAKQRTFESDENKESKESAHVAPPTASTETKKSTTSETNIYLIAIIFIILAFLISRFL